MITKLIFKSKDNSDIQIQEGVCAVNTDSYPVIQSESALIQFKKSDDKTVLRFKEDTLQNMFNRVIPARSARNIQAGNFMTINGVIPDQRNGAFYILGSECLSVTDFYDRSDPSTIADNKTMLKIFDGCIPCNFCPKIAQLKRDIRECQLYLNYLKDCNLYYPDEAEQRLNAGIVTQEDKTYGCATKDLKFNNIQPAIKLLYQYKAAVMLWNYLVSISKSNIQVLQAPQDWGGFVVQSKRSVDMCAIESGSTVTFQIFVKLQSGQTAQYLSALNCGMGFYIEKVAQNTYMQYGKDSGMHVSRGQTAQGIEPLFKVPALDGGQIYASITFNPARSAVTVFAASIKILPTIFLLDYKYYNTDPQTGEKTTVRLSTPVKSPEQIESLSLWNKYRLQATSLSDSSYVDHNHWAIYYRWTVPSVGGTDTIDDNTIYYTTAFNRYASPQPSDSLEEGEQQNVEESVNVQEEPDI